MQKLKNWEIKIQRRDFRIREKDRMAHFMIDDNRICHGIALLSDYRQIYNNQERTPNNQSVRQFQAVKQSRSFVRRPTCAVDFFAVSWEILDESKLHLKVLVEFM